MGRGERRYNHSVLRILYMGTPQFAVPALEALIDSPHTVVALVSQPDRPRGRGQHVQPTPTKAVALAHGVPVMQPTRLKDPALHDEWRALAPDLGVVAAYGRILPDALLELPRLGMINIHASLLPKYRGAAPIHRAIIDGEAQTGVTIMRVVSQLDAGPMLLTGTRAIGADETTTDIEPALALLGASLVLDAVNQLASGPVVETPQDDAQATYAAKIEKYEGAIAWDLPAERIHNLVRGLHPWPLVSAKMDGKRILIHRTKLTDARSDAPSGTLLAEDGLAVVAGDGRVLQIVEIQPEGKRAMSARDFLAGHRLPASARFEPLPPGP
jgi:methionyl-tRNA formyltransferase